MTTFRVWCLYSYLVHELYRLRAHDLNTAVYDPVLFSICCVSMMLRWYLEHFLEWNLQCLHFSLNYVCAGYFRQLALYRRQQQLALFVNFFSNIFQHQLLLFLILFA
jgi:hypothetical protein